MTHHNLVLEAVLSHLYGGWPELLYTGQLYDINNINMYFVARVFIPLDQLSEN